GPLENGPGLTEMDKVARLDDGDMGLLRSVLVIFKENVIRPVLHGQEGVRKESPRGRSKPLNRRRRVPEEQIAHRFSNDSAHPILLTLGLLPEELRRVMSGEIF